MSADEFKKTMADFAAEHGKVELHWLLIPALVDSTDVSRAEYQGDNFKVVITKRKLAGEKENMKTNDEIVLNALATDAQALMKRRMKTEMTTEQAILLYRTIETMTKQFDAENDANGKPTWLDWINSAANDAARMHERTVVPVEMARELASRLDECYRERARRHAEPANA